MIILRSKHFSMLNKIEDKLNQQHITDYEVFDKIPTEEISVTAELKNTVIYVPDEMEDELYRIDDFLRREARFLRTKIGLPDKKGIKTLQIQGTLTIAQYVKLIKYIVDEVDFCGIIE